MSAAPPYSTRRARQTLANDINRQTATEQVTGTGRVYGRQNSSPTNSSPPSGPAKNSKAPSLSEKLFTEHFPLTPPGADKMSSTCLSARTPTFSSPQSSQWRLHLVGSNEDSALSTPPTLPPQMEAMYQHKRGTGPSAPLTSKNMAEIEARAKRVLTKPNFGNDYSTCFVKDGVLPQNWVRNVSDPQQGYPKLQLLHQIKQTHNQAHAHPPVGISTGSSVWNRDVCAAPSLEKQLEEMAENGANFDVVMLHGCVNEWPAETFDRLKINSITPRPSLLFFWVPTMRIEEGRMLMEKWGFRRGEDITYMVSDLKSFHAPKRQTWDSDSSIFVPTTWHCLMGLKGTLRRTSDTDLINCNVDTDVIIEKPGQRANVVPEQIYQIIENFTNMRRKIHIVPTATPEELPVRLRPGWVTVGPSAMNFGGFNGQTYRHRSLVPVHPDVDCLRPQTPPPR